MEKEMRLKASSPVVMITGDQNEPDHHNCRLRSCGFTSGLTGNATALTLISRNYNLGRSSRCRSCTDRLRAHTWRYVYVYFKVFANVGSLIQVLPCVSHCVCMFFFYACLSLGVLRELLVLSVWHGEALRRSSGGSSSSTPVTIVTILIYSSVYKNNKQFFFTTKKQDWLFAY